MKTLLLTGFEPFEGQNPNPSWAVAKGTKEAWSRRQDPNLQIEAVEVPILWHGAFPILQRKIIECRPSYLVCMGYDGGLTLTPQEFQRKVNRLCMELLARNEAAPIPDDAGEYYEPGQTGTVKIAPRRPDTYPSRLPASMFQQRYPEIFVTSENAGGYLCNFVFFQAMAHFPEIEQKGFIHVGRSEKTIADGIKVLTNYAEWLAGDGLARSATQTRRAAQESAGLAGELGHSQTGT